MAEASDLALFALLAEAGSFRKAALLARMSTPGFSKRISRLEAALSTQLVLRNTRSMALTEAGRRLLTHASAVRQHQQAALSEISRLQTAVRGQIVVSAPTISGDILLSDLVADFCLRYPEVQVDLRLDNRYADLIRDGIDIAIRTGKLEDSSLRARWLIDSDWVVCAAPDYLQQHGSIDDPAQLEGHNCLIYGLQDGGPSQWQFHDRSDEATGSYTVAVSGSVEANNGLVLKKCALRGLGVIYVPRCLVHREMELGSLCEILQHHAAKSQGVYAITPFARHKTPVVRLLIDEIAAAYRANAHWFRAPAK